MKRTLYLALFILVPISVGGLAGFFTITGIGSWYSTLNKPFFNPPNWIFGPVWTTLYILMGISSYLIWLKPNSAARNRALTAYGIQLFLNFWWSILFFTLENPLMALIEILLLWVALYLTIRIFYRIRPLASILLWPYLAWVSFATLLNTAIFWLN